MKRILRALGLVLGASWPLFAGSVSPPAGNYINNVSTNAATQIFSVSSGTVAGKLTVGSCVTTLGGSCGAGGGSSATVSLASQYSDAYYSAPGSSNVIAGLAPGTTWMALLSGGPNAPPVWFPVILGTGTLQSGATFYVSSGTLAIQLNIGTGSNSYAIYPGSLQLKIQSPNTYGISLYAGNTESFYVSTTIARADEPIQMVESVAPSASSGSDFLWGDSTYHWPRFNPNGSASSYLVIGSSTSNVGGHLVAWSGNGESLVDGGAGLFINNSSSLQSGATFYTSSGTAVQFNATTATITNLVLPISTGSVLGINSAGVVSSITINGMVPGASYYAQISPASQQSGAINVASGTVTTLNVTTAIVSGIGSASNPVLTFSGVNNSGFYGTTGWNGKPALGISLGGVSDVFISSTSALGNSVGVGIGTNIPIGKLQVSANSSGPYEYALVLQDLGSQGIFNTILDSAGNTKEYWGFLPAGTNYNGSQDRFFIYNGNAYPKFALETTYNSDSTYIHIGHGPSSYSQLGRATLNVYGNEAIGNDLESTTNTVPINGLQVEGQIISLSASPSTFTALDVTNLYMNGQSVSSTTWLSASSATATYLQSSSATATYLTQSSATATYFQAASSTTLLTTSSATATYLQSSSATATYLNQNGVPYAMPSGVSAGGVFAVSTSSNVTVSSVPTISGNNFSNVPASSISGTFTNVTVSSNTILPGATFYNGGPVAISTNVFISSAAIYVQQYGNATYVAIATITWTNSNVQKLLLTANTAINFNPPPHTEKITLKLLTGSGGYVVTWPANVHWVPTDLTPTITTAASKADIVICYYWEDTGTYTCSVNGSQSTTP